MNNLKKNDQLILFFSQVALWFFRDPDFMTGWAPAISPGGNGFVKVITSSLKDTDCSKKRNFRMLLEPEVIFVTDITNHIRGEKTVMWRNLVFLWRIWTIDGVLSKFLPFLFQIYVEKNLRGENVCGEKMTIMGSARSQSALAQSQEAGTPCIWKYFFGLFLLGLSLIKPSQVMFTVKNGPTALNFG